MEMKRLLAVVLLALGGIVTFCQRADANFHFMQIHQVIGGVDGDPNAQAIQLRMRSAGQNVVAQSRIRAWDAAGANPVLLVNITTNLAFNFAGGPTVLITTPGFAAYTTPTVVPDFTMNPIPASYLPAGKITFEDDFGTVYWGLAWGGAAYTGTNTGALGVNDADGNFNPPYAGALPSGVGNTQALLLNRLFNQVSTNNAANYVLTAGAATFTNYAGANFLVTIPPLPDPDSADFDGDDDVDGEDFLTWQRNTGGAGTFAQGDANHDGNIDGDDLAIWETQYNTVPPLSGLVAVPEPSWICLVFGGLLGVGSRRSRWSRP